MTGVQRDVTPLSPSRDICSAAFVRTILKERRSFGLSLPATPAEEAASPEGAATNWRNPLACVPESPCGAEPPVDQSEACSGSSKYARTGSATRIWELSPQHTSISFTISGNDHMTHSNPGWGGVCLDSPSPLIRYVVTTRLFRILLPR